MLHVIQILCKEKFRELYIREHADFKLLQRRRSGFRSSGILRGLGWQKAEGFFFDCLILEGGTDRVSRNIGTHLILRGLTSNLTKTSTQGAVNIPASVLNYYVPFQDTCFLKKQ